jgi:hypothetical protein
MPNFILLQNNIGCLKLQWKNAKKLGKDEVNKQAWDDQEKPKAKVILDIKSPKKPR